MATKRCLAMMLFPMLLVAVVSVSCGLGSLVSTPEAPEDVSAIETRVAKSVLATMTASAPTAQPTQATTASASATPTVALPTDTPTPTLSPATSTPVPPTAIPTSVPSPTMPPNTPPGAVLEVGQGWTQGGILLTLTEVEYGSTFNYPGQTLLHFRLVNETPDQILFTLDCVEWHVSDNLGNRYPCDEIGTRGGSGYERLDFQVDSQDTQVVVVRVDGIPYDSGITSMDLMADSVSRITGAAWTWMVHH